MRNLVAIFLFVAVIVNLNAAGAKVPELKPDKQIIYKKTPQGDLKLHVFFPPNYKQKKKFPAMILFFGGGWIGGKAALFYPHCRYFADRGMVCIAPEYRIRSTHKTSPLEAVSDAKSAMRWIKKHHSDLKVDTNRLVAGGSSAGGHLAAATAFVNAYDDPKDDLKISPCPNALVLFCPVIDNGPDGYGYKRIKDEYKKFSPMHNISKSSGKCPDTIFILGKRDHLIPLATAKKFKKEIESKKAECQLVVYPKAGHGSFYSGKYYQLAIKEVENFLKKHKFIK